ncbi:Lin0512 family protein [Megalodesulfovibrio paquesii]
MARKRFAIELGYGADLHGADMTKAAVRAVKDAISRSCLCGLAEICGIATGTFTGVHVHVEIAAPDPAQVEEAAVTAAVPIGTKSFRAVPGGMRVPGLEVPCFGPGVSDIVVACACLTVSVDLESSDSETTGTVARCLAGSNTGGERDEQS